MEEKEEDDEDDGYAEEFSKSKVWEKHVSDVIKSTRFLVRYVKFFSDMNRLVFLACH